MECKAVSCLIMFRSRQQISYRAGQPNIEKLQSSISIKPQDCKVVLRAELTQCMMVIERKRVSIFSHMGVCLDWNSKFQGMIRKYSNTLEPIQQAAPLVTP
jgi:hypothetical protein